MQKQTHACSLAFMRHIIHVVSDTVPLKTFLDSLDTQSQLDLDEQDL